MKKTDWIWIKNSDNQFISATTAQILRNYSKKLFVALILHLRNRCNFFVNDTFEYTLLDTFLIIVEIFRQSIGPTSEPKPGAWLSHPPSSSFSRLFTINNLSSFSPLMAPLTAICNRCQSPVWYDRLKTTGSLTCVVRPDRLLSSPRLVSRPHLPVALLSLGRLNGM